MNSKISEKEINNKISKYFKKDFLVIQQTRILPAEFDIILLDPETLQLVNIEIKKNKWKYLVDQALRGKLYCHYSIAVLPLSFKKIIPINHFEECGVGLYFYEFNRNKLDLIFELHPRKSKEINRGFKKRIYEEFYIKYGNLIYA